MEVVHGAVAVVTVTAPMDEAGWEALLRTSLREWDSGVRVLVVDLSLTAMPQGAPLGLLPEALRRVGGWPRRVLHLVAGEAEVYRALARAGLPRYLSLHRSRAAALRVARSETGEDWRHCDLPSTPESPRAGRLLLEHLCAQAGEVELVPDADLVVSELVANAIRYSRGPITLSLAVEPHQVWIAVSDGSAEEPELRRPDPDSERGRGMQIVDALSDRWGVRAAYGGGKAVWATLSLPKPA